MTEKNVVKFLVGLGVPAEKHTDIIAKADAEDFDVSELLDYAKKFAEPLIKPTIEKAARTEGASGAISKVLKTLYDSIKDDSTPSFEEWKKLPEVKDADYAELIKTYYGKAKMAGMTDKDAIKEISTKLEKAVAALAEKDDEVSKKELEWQGKLDKKDLDYTLEKTLQGFEKKPLKATAYKYFMNDLADEGVEIRLHDSKPTLFKKGETAPLQNSKGNAFVTIEEKFNNWATENNGLFVNSAGNVHQDVDPKLEKGGKVSDDGKHIMIPGHRPIPAN